MDSFEKGVGAMKTNGLNVPDLVRERFARLGYSSLQEEYPDFGGIILYLRTNGSQPEAAYYLEKRSTFEVVSSDELRNALEFSAGSGIPLRYAVTNSDFTPGAYKLAAEAKITTWPLKTQQSEIS
jgi:hypothetical protein